MKALRVIWTLYLAVIAFIPFLVTYPLLYLFTARKKWYPLAHKYRIVWGNFICAASGLRQSVTLEDEIDPKQTYVIVANHTSYLDIISTTCGIPVYFNYMAKYELKKIPLFGRFFSTIDIAVNRQNRRESVIAFHEANKRIKNGTSVLIFPEGSITKETPKLSRFKSGAFKLAVDNQIPILPVTILDNYKRLPDGNLFGGGPGKMRMIIHRPIEVSNLKAGEEKDLIQKIYIIIETTLEKESL